METALVIGASGGIGQAVSVALDKRGIQVSRLSRSKDGFDLASEQETQQTLAKLKGPYDLIFVATGALEIGDQTPEKTIRSISAHAMMAQFAVNAVGPALVLKEAHRLLPRKRSSVFAVLSARVGSIGDNRLGGWISYRAAKAALNQVVHTAAIELGRTHPQASVVALHPGTVQTAFTEKYLGRHPSVTPYTAAQNLLAVIDDLGPPQSGGFYDWSGQEVPW